MCFLENGFLTKEFFFSDQETRRAFSEMSLARTFFSLVVERNCGLFEKLDEEDSFWYGSREAWCVFWDTAL